MKFFLIIFIILIQVSFAIGQDGSDIYFLETKKLDNTWRGRKLQIDFYRRSSRDINIDKVILEIRGKKIEFIEHREDDGFNIWFSEQYLESVESKNGTKTIIRYFRLLEINQDSILVAAYIGSCIEEMKIPLKDIAVLLFDD